ncbi:unnamed protein product [Effrenium voratum]|nr:unnamed protein product [Effrenium voratum]
MAATQTKDSLRSLTKDFKQRSKAAGDARQEFYDTVNWSDAFLLAIMLGFSILGNIYPPQRRQDLVIGLVLFISCFLVYLCMKGLASGRGEGQEPEASECEAEAIGGLKRLGVMLNTWMDEIHFAPPSRNLE